jgi:predicted ribosomally synthesized peptide with SipW-like signal peptide
MKRLLKTKPQIPTNKKTLRKERKIMKKKFLKALVIVGCAILLVIATITGTVAYLTSVKEVTNTFTVGKVEITLDESDMTALDPATAPRVKENEYHLLPGQTYTKDPIVHVAKNSEECYLFVKVVNPIASVEKAGTTKIAAQIEANGWTVYADGVYVRTVAKSASQTDIKLFDTVVISEAVTNEQLEALDGKNIVITAYAVQTAGFADDVNAAWAAVKDIAP